MEGGAAQLVRDTSPSCDCTVIQLPARRQDEWILCACLSCLRDGEVDVLPVALQCWLVAGAGQCLDAKQQATPFTCVVFLVC